MAEITVRRRGELVRGVFSILIEESEGLQAKEVLRRLVEVVPPTDFEDSKYPRNPTVRRYEKIVRFSTITAVKAGWLIKDRGQWSLTDEGARAYRELTEPEAFEREARRLYKKWKDQQPEADPEEPEDDEVAAATTLEEAEEAAWSGIEDYLSEINPFEFQDLVAGLLRGMGYHISWVSPPGPDRGVDIIAHTDPLGIEGARVKVQVKRRADRATVQDIRSFMAVLGDGDSGLFVCSGGFTKDASDEARNQEKRRIMLVDLKRLFDLWVGHYEQIPEATRQLLPLRTVHFLAPDD